MIENYNYLYQYLHKEKINIDKKEFEFQIKFHPDYPSFLAIVDTLSFLNIDNDAIRLPSSEIELLPERFMAFLKEENNIPRLSFIEKKGKEYIQTQDKTTFIMSQQEIEARWESIVLLVEKSEVERTKSSNKLSWIFALPFLITFTLVLSGLEGSLETKLFFLIPILGMLFSIAALKDLFDTQQNELLNSFCNMTSSTSCSTVVGSTKWKIFEIINFSDLSLVFFTSQFLGFLVFLFSGDVIGYFIIQKILLLSSIPVLLLSVYYQRFIENKWCPICLVIIAVILLELGYVIIFQHSYFAISSKIIVVFAFIFVSVVFTWLALKKLLIRQKDLKDGQLKAIRFERNYSVFKNSLLAKQKVQLPKSLILLGNKESTTIITIISNPFCGHCKGSHEIIEEILAKHHNNILIQVIIKTNLETESEEGKELCRNLMGIYKHHGEEAFLKALRSWFDNRSLNEWFDLYRTNLTLEFDIMFDNQRKWCEENDYNFTPSIFVNGYEYPKVYDRSNLPFYINELVEDKF